MKWRNYFCDDVMTEANLWERKFSHSAIPVNYTSKFWELLKKLLCMVANHKIAYARESWSASNGVELHMLLCLNGTWHPLLDQWQHADTCWGLLIHCCSSSLLIHFHDWTGCNGFWDDGVDEYVLDYLGIWLITVTEGNRRGDGPVLNQWVLKISRMTCFRDSPNGIFEKNVARCQWCEHVECIQQDRVHWWVVLNMLMNLKGVETSSQAAWVSMQLVGTGIHCPGWGSECLTHYFALKCLVTVAVVQLSRQSTVWQQQLFSDAKGLNILSEPFKIQWSTVLTWQQCQVLLWTAWCHSRKSPCINSRTKILSLSISEHTSAEFLKTAVDDFGW
jgi:hypothetical protein